MASYEALHLDPGETVILEVRRHWIVFVGHVVSFVLLSLFPIIVYLLTVAYVPALALALTSVPFSLYVFLYILWLLLMWIGFFLAWTKFFLDVWYVTGSRIIDIEQRQIFYRNVSNIRFDKIQDITIEVNGLLATFLDYGDVRVQTASENEDDFFMRSVRRPDHVRQVIFAQHNFVGDKYIAKPPSP